MTTSLKQMLETSLTPSRTIGAAAAYALHLPDLRETAPANTSDDGFLTPLTAAITRMRENQCAQLICSNTAANETDKKQVQNFIRELLDTVQLPGEKIEFEIKIGKKTGLIVITLFKENV